MKTRLAEVLRDEFDKGHLETLEEYHTLLLKEEEFINLVRHNITDLMSFLDNAPSSIQRVTDGEALYNNLKDQVCTAMTRFYKLKIEFYSFMSSRA